MQKINIWVHAENISSSSIINLAEDNQLSKMNRWIFLLLAISLFQVHAVQNCIEFRDGQCYRCPFQTHEFQNECYTDSYACLEYVALQPQVCKSCDESQATLQNGTCRQIPGLLRSQSVLTTNAGDNHGQANFMFMELEEALKDPLFLRVNNYIKFGEYGFRISNSRQPIVSVHTYLASNNTRQFKILYEGRGAGLYLGIISIQPESLFIRLRSFVLVGVTDHCIDYNIRSECISCRRGYHLDAGKCYLNVGKCLSYYGGLCMRCKQFSILLENRCVSDCGFVGDTRAVYFYHRMREELTEDGNIEKGFGMLV